MGIAIPSIQMPPANIIAMMASASKLNDERERFEHERKRKRDSGTEFPDIDGRGPAYAFFDGYNCAFSNCAASLHTQPSKRIKATFPVIGGFRVCSVCRYQQPGSQVMIQDEERRTFADDRERGIDHARTERVREGETGGCSVPSSLQRASRMVESNASGKVKDRESRYIEHIRKLADEIQPFSAVMRESATSYARDLPRAVDEHRECCTDKNCRLLKLPRDGFLVAAALVRKAALDYLLDVKPTDLSETYLKRVGSEHKPGTVDRIYNVVRDLLNGYEADGKYNCTTANVQAPAGAPDRALLKYTQTVQRVCEAMELSYPTQLRAKEIVADWFNQGLGGNTHEVVAGAAVWSVVKDEGGQIEAVADAAGCAANTIKKELAKHI